MNVSDDNLFELIEWFNKELQTLGKKYTMSEIILAFQLAFHIHMNIHHNKKIEQISKEKT